MNFEKFKELVCNKVEDRLRPTIGVAIFHPYPSEDEDGMFDIFPDDAMNLIKPIVNINVVTDFYNSHKFLELELKYDSVHDEELTYLFNKLTIYTNELTKNIDDDAKRPALSVSILPSGELMGTDNRYMLEMVMPLQIGLVAKRVGGVVNTISMLFLLEKCNLSEIEGVDFEEAKREAEYEDNEELREYEEELRRQEEHQAFIEKQEKNMKLMEEKMQESNKNDNIRKVGR